MREALRIWVSIWLIIPKSGYNVVEIFENYNVKNLSTFKIGGNVKKAAFPGCVEELIKLLESEEFDIVLGNCSNVLFSSEDIDKNVIFTEKINKYTLLGNKATVFCGTKGSVVSRECCKRSLTGFEFLIGFPGSFGGMICMNASAHNQSIADCFIQAKVYDIKNKEILILNKKDMDFKYRHSAVSNGNFVVLEAEFELKEGDSQQINDIMKRNIEFRQQRQPSLSFPNAGSIFKNPENDSAGRLLDLCEMKGKTLGGACVFDKHANFIINVNNASSKDVINLMYEMYNKVKEKYRIELKPEIKYIGNEGSWEYGLWKEMTENIHQIQK